MKPGGVCKEELGQREENPRSSAEVLERQPFRKSKWTRVAPAPSSTVGLYGLCPHGRWCRGKATSHRHVL